jgi:hypothetical protein
MTSVPGLDFNPAWDHKLAVDFGGKTAPVLSRADVLASKKATGRARDRRDVKGLTRP